MQAARRSATRFIRQIADDLTPMATFGKTTHTGSAPPQTVHALHTRQILLYSSKAPTTGYGSCIFAPGRVCGPASVRHTPNFDRRSQGFTSSAQAFAEAALDREELTDEAQQKQFLDLEAEDDDYLEGSLEDEFEEEKGRRSLASLFGSDEDDYVEVDAALEDESLLVENCGLSQQTIQALHARGVKSLFPIQKHVFDPAMSGRDLIGRAKTGSGKTLAFSLPVIEFLKKEANDTNGRVARGRAPRCIVLAPTRELAKQVEREFAGSATGLNVGCFYGGVGIETQIRDLRRGMDVVVGTPGRIIDLMERKVLNLGQIKFFILDEADMMLSQGFDQDVERILEEVPADRQTMLFSATMPSWVKQLTRQHLTQPVMVDLVGEASSGRLNEDITALAVQVEPSMRRSVLVDVLTVYGAGKSIVFTQTKREADEVAAGVSQAIPCEALHGDMSQRDRERRLDNFRKGKFAVLVATDVASRGLDIPNVDLVLHYELPRDVESFLHRSGRTARAGKTGTTIALFSRMETGMLRRIVKQVGVKNLEIMGPPGPRQVMEASAKQVLRRLDVIDEDVKAFFQPAAKLVMAESDPEDALCRALAALSGLTEVPKPRSLLTQQEGYVTLRIMSRPGRIKASGHIMTIVRNVLGQAACDEVGRIRLIREDQSQGAAFDLPEELSKQMLSNQAELVSREFTLDVPKSLPLEDESNFGPRQGKFGGGGGGRGGSRSSYGGGYGGSSGGNRRQGGGRGGGSYGNSRGSYGGSRGNGRDSGSRRQDSSRGGYGGGSRGGGNSNYGSW